MSRFQVLSLAIINLIIFLSKQATSQTDCFVVYITIDNSSITDADLLFDGIYKLDSIQDGCPIFESTSNQILAYAQGSWSITANDGITSLSLTTPAGNPCNPPGATTDLDETSWIPSTGGFPTTLFLDCATTDDPSTDPTDAPTSDPTSDPTGDPTSDPSIDPTMEPTMNPTTSLPSQSPSYDPTVDPTGDPTSDPTSAEPSMTPSESPSANPIPSPTRAPTEICDRLVITSVVGGGSIIGTWYMQPNIWSSGYPWYRHIDQTNPNYMVWEDDYWTIHQIDTGKIYQYQVNQGSSTGAYVPPNGPSAVTWQNPDINFEGDTISIIITCTAITNTPTMDPTQEPTRQPSISPTAEPTMEPTTARPTAFPTEEPTILTSSTVINEPAEEEPFYEFFTILEWIIIAAVCVICCLVICALCFWRNREIDKAKKEADAHNLSAVVGGDDGLEMGQKKKRPMGSLDFGDTGRQMSGPTTAGNKTPVVSYKDKDNEADFANALAVVSSHKSQNSLYKNSVASQSVASEEDPKSYNSDANSGGGLSAGPGSVDPAMIGKKDSEFYGNHPIDEIYSYTFITKPFGMEWKTTKADKKNLYVSKVQPKSQAALGNVKVGSKLISFNGEMIEDMGAKNIYGKLAVSEMPLTITFLKPFKREMDKEGDGGAAKPKKLEKVMSESGADPEAAAPSHEVGPAPGPYKPQLEKRDTTPPAPHSPQASDIPPEAVPPDREIDNDANDGDDGQPIIPPPVPPVPVDEDDPFNDDIGPPPVPLDPKPKEEGGNKEEHEPKISVMTQAQNLIPAVFEETPVVDTQDSFHQD